MSYTFFSISSCSMCTIRSKYNTVKIMHIIYTFLAYINAVIARNGLMNWIITNLLFIFVIMINWREYRVLCYSTKIAAATDAWNLQCRMQSIALACNRSLAKPVTSFFGLQPINDSGDDRGLCTTPLESLSISMPFLSNTLHREWDCSRCSLKIERQWFHKLGIPLARKKREKRNSRFYERSASSKK